MLFSLLYIHIRDGYVRFSASHSFISFFLFFLFLIFWFLSIFNFADEREGRSSFKMLSVLRGSAKGRVEGQARMPGRNSPCWTHLCVWKYSRVGAPSRATHYQVAPGGNVREGTHDRPPFTRGQIRSIAAAYDLQNQFSLILLMTWSDTRESLLHASGLSILSPLNIIALSPRYNLTLNKFVAVTKCLISLCR